MSVEQTLLPLFPQGQAKAQMSFEWFLHQSWILQLFFVAVLGVVATLAYFVVSNWWATLRRLPVWFPGENTFIDPSTKEQHQFASLEESEPSVYLTVVIPAYNETKRLPKMLDEALGYLDERKRADKDFSYEVIVVDDGSKDDTTKVALDYAKRNPSAIHVLTLARNRGKGGAVKRGVLCASGKYILMADADGATKFSEVMSLEKALIKCENHGLGVAVGSREHLRRTENERRPFIRNLLMYGFHVFVVLCGVTGIKDTQCGFKLFSRRAAQLLFPNLNVERWAFDVELLFNAQHLKIPIAEVDVKWEEIAGSTLDPLTATLQMAKDIFRIRLLYTCKVWYLTKETHTLHKSFL